MPMPSVVTVKIGSGTNCISGVTPVQSINEMNESYRIVEVCNDEIVIPSQVSVNVTPRMVISTVVVRISKYLT